MFPGHPMNDEPVAALLAAQAKQQACHLTGFQVRNRTDEEPGLVVMHPRGAVGNVLRVQGFPRGGEAARIAAMQGFVRPLLMLLVGTVLGRGSVAQGPVVLEVPTPPGYRATGGGNRHVLTRRNPKAGVRIRIEARIEDDPATDLSKFLETRRRPAEKDAAGGATHATLAGRKGLQVAFEGDYAGRGGTRHGRRKVRAARLSPGKILLVEQLVTWGDTSPGLEILRAADKALETLARGIVTKASTGNAESTTPPRAGGPWRTYDNDHVLPFSFEVPETWQIIHDEEQLPGSLWVLASPDGETMQKGDWADISTSLDVAVVGCHHGLLGAADPLARAAIMLRGEWAARGRTLEAVSETLVGGAKGRLFRMNADEDGRSGLVLLAVAPPSTLVASVVWPGEKEDEAAATALDILQSFRADPGPRPRDVESKTLGMTLPVPGGWNAEAVATDDESEAWALTAPSGLELVLRASPLESGHPLLDADPPLLRKSAELYFSDEMNLFTSTEVEEGVLAAWESGSSAWQTVRIGKGGSLDAWIGARDGLLLAAILRAPPKASSRERGLAHSVLIDLRGPGTDESPKKPGDSRLRQLGMVWVSQRLLPFDAAGRLAPHPTWKLRPGADGVWWLGTAHAKGSEDSGTLNLEVDGLPEPWTLTRDGRFARDATGRIWWPVPDLH